MYLTGFPISDCMCHNTMESNTLSLTYYRDVFTLHKLKVRENMAKFEECDMILIYHLCSVLILNVTKWIKSKQLICPDPELLHDMWIKWINISTITIYMSQDTLTKLITTVINVFYPTIGLFCPFGIFKLFFCHNQ